MIYQTVFIICYRQHNLKKIKMKTVFCSIIIMFSFTLVFSSVERKIAYAGRRIQQITANAPTYDFSIFIGEKIGVKVKPAVMYPFEIQQGMHTDFILLSIKKEYFEIYWPTTVLKFVAEFEDGSTMPITIKMLFCKVEPVQEMYLTEKFTECSKLNYNVLFHTIDILLSCEETETNFVLTAYSDRIILLETTPAPGANCQLIVKITSSMYIIICAILFIGFLIFVGCVLHYYLFKKRRLDTRPLIE